MGHVYDYNLKQVVNDSCPAKPSNTAKATAEYLIILTNPSPQHMAHGAVYRWQHNSYTTLETLLQCYPVASSASYHLYTTCPFDLSERL